MSECCHWYRFDIGLVVCFISHLTAQLREIFVLLWGVSCGGVNQSQIAAADQ